jgi:hypothetical protein
MENLDKICIENLTKLIKFSANINNTSDESLRFLFCLIISTVNPHAIASMQAERIIKYIRTGQD